MYLSTLLAVQYYLMLHVDRSVNMFSSKGSFEKTGSYSDVSSCTTAIHNLHCYTVFLFSTTSLTLINYCGTAIFVHKSCIEYVKLCINITQQTN